VVWNSISNRGDSSSIENSGGLHSRKPLGNFLGISSGSNRSEYHHPGDKVGSMLEPSSLAPSSSTSKGSNRSS